MLLLRRIPYWVVLALLVYMPFHVFLSQSLSLVTGGLDAWKVAKDVVLGFAALFTICLVLQQRRGNKLFYWLLGLSVLYAGLHIALWGLHPDLYQKSAILGLIYNTRLPAFLLLGYGAVLLNPNKFVFSSVIKVILAVSTVVAFLGVMQFLLPKDILAHVGYSIDRGARPAFFIDDKANLPRIMSTLREPNALGAYLILPFTALSLLLLRLRDNRRLLLTGVWLLHGLAIFLTFSRSAWLGSALAVVLVVWWRYSTQFVRLFKRYWWLAVAVMLLLAVLGFTERNNQFTRSYITHSTQGVAGDPHSNGYHWLFVREGVEGIVAEPVGHGPGTAGIVSIQNPKGSFLTENYYVQIGYEVGVLGLAVFVALSVLTYLTLYRRHDHIGVTLLASFWAYVLTNMLLHTWSNEAVAAQWWLLAGLAVMSAKSAEKLSF